MKKSVLAAVVVALSLSSGAGAKTHQIGTAYYHTHHCDQRKAWCLAADRRWGHKQHLKALARIEAQQDRQEAVLGTFTVFDRCVASHESGNQQRYNGTYTNVTWGLYDGYYQFDWSTWHEAGGGVYADRAYGATLEQQTIIFNRFEPTHPSRWPNTVPPCLGL